MSELRLFDNPGSDVAQITTSGDVIKPFLNAIDKVADEVRLQLTDDGFEVRANDPANVCMVDISLSADAFDTYDLESETMLGVDIGDLQSLVRRARKNSDDELELAIQEREITATVSRGYDNHNVVSQGSTSLIDPDSIRQSPDVPELDRGVNIEIDRGPFVDALSYGVGLDIKVEFEVKGVNQHSNALYIGSETDTRKESAAINNIDCDKTGVSWYSKDYMKSLLSAVGEINSSTVTVIFDDEMPISLKMSDDDVQMQVEYLMAPRVRQDE